MTSPLPSVDDPLALAAVHIEALYLIDDQGRILGCRNSPNAPVPRIHLVRTRAGNRWWFGVEVPQPLTERLARVFATEPIAKDLQGQPPREDEVVALLRTHAPVTRSYRGPAFTFPEALPPSKSAVVVPRPLSADTRFRGPFAWVRDDADGDQPIAACFVDGVAVSVCHSARGSAVACEAGVDTVKEHRRRGHGSDVTTCWADAVRRGGRIPLYSTDWSNAASRGVTQRLGLRIYAEDWNLG